MSTPPVPVVFVPIFKPKPWGGRRLATLLGKSLPCDQPIGESWELSDLPGHESRVRDGVLAGQTLGQLAALWGRDLLGDAAPADERFPLLFKFLDACDNLSVQVHPKPSADDPGGRGPGVKHEAWYILHAEPGAKLWIGLKPGVGPADVARAANTPAMVDLLHAWHAAPGRCFYLPSGTPHALGAGIVVAEVQTASDVTYRLYDWERTGLDGRPRELHVPQALANIRYDFADELIGPPPGDVMLYRGVRAARLAACERFELFRTTGARHSTFEVPTGIARVWMILAGRGHIGPRRPDHGQPCAFRTGDVVLLPAHGPQRTCCLADDTEWLDVTILNPQ